ncbi:MAG TPA: NAD(P)/FAD-dependent oxidoreductase [Vicinamibacterales bacterium]|nr:NAD(P)/FAD-dependent oxidoreductase [Vicinamibacterales bacterium]
MDIWDAIVIGAGPAGALSACLLAREGLAVLLVERRAFPRRKVCGGCLNASALASLDRSGLGGRVRSLGALPLDTLRLHHRGRQARVALPAGLAVSRAALDLVLADAAAEAGCERRFETTATIEPRWDDEAGSGCRRVLLRGAGGRDDEARARAVVVADGLGHVSLRDCAGFTSVVQASARVGIGGEAGPGIVGVEPGSITMAVTRHGYVGAVEVEGGQVNIAAAVDPPFLKNAGGPAAAVQAILRDAGVPVNGTLESVDWLGTLPLTRRLARPAARGIFVLGDAAGYVEPFTGEGMAWAFAGAEAVVPFVKRAAAAPDPRLEDEWVRALARSLGRDQRRCRILAWNLRQPVLVAMFMSLLQRAPRLAASVLARFSPPTHPTPERTA